MRLQPSKKISLTKSFWPWKKPLWIALFIQEPGTYAPSIGEEEEDAVADQNKTKIEWRAVVVEMDGVEYALNQKTGEVYDLEEYNRGEAVKVGTLEIIGKQYKYVPI